MGHRVVGTPADPDAVRAVEQMSAVVDEAVVHGDALRRRIFVDAPAAADVDAAAAEVVDVALPDEVVLAARPQPDPVGAGMGDLAALEDRMPQSARHDQPRLIDLALPRIAQAPQVGVRVLEAEPAEMQMLDGFAFRRVPVEADQGRGQDRRDRLDRGHVLAGQGVVVDGGGVPVQIPLARFVQRLEDVFDIVALLASPSVPWPRAPAPRGRPGWPRCRWSGRDGSRFPRSGKPRR